MIKKNVCRNVCSFVYHDVHFSNKINFHFDCSSDFQYFHLRRQVDDIFKLNNCLSDMVHSNVN